MDPEAVLCDPWPLVGCRALPQGYMWLPCRENMKWPCPQNLLGIVQQRQATPIWALKVGGSKGDQLCVVNTAKGHIWGRRGKGRTSFLVYRESSRTAELLHQRNLV